MNSCDHYNYVKTKAYLESLKDLSANMCLRSLRLNGDQALSSSLVLKMSNKEDFKDFKAMTEKANFLPSKLVTFPSE